MTINGLCTVAVIHRRGPRCIFDAVTDTTFEWVDWIDNGRLLEPIGIIALV
ncbi:hypothetical protein JQU17_09940 [Ponticoccus sp. SC2-23]|nr:hypothetical protein [Ponticoccus sp. SC6-9]MBM1224675.1 hypothetical protein [Ponticoccus sp. SC6-15]MBM1228188.1 hypothetical protein [Ponticoccus sp. SC6-38]MBM1234174.1 hypothetical protein [Ponticoccus sp. SC6-45]MBM1238690.1 hypothetical protein [Ponticoccus sp. SC6-49]MBM1242471.1 hypothetical protein [Ponticoccus sp. SC2-64]MBM1247698.1 hypothetical protein [Ponticoccus sp. SC6-42]MBM1251643.1 hypothetical protein [Ponticoccus sp. SC6-33]MBM1256699.1 hypothetical protein [Pontico